jgi:hypothetical protein
MQRVRVDSAAQSDSFPYARKNVTHRPAASLSICSSDLRSMDAERTLQTSKLIISGIYTRGTHGAKHVH